jgi:hypothetical protein
MKAQTAYQTLGSPEIHINEYASSEDHLIPGWSVGWLYYMEKAGVDASNRACWDVVQGKTTWSDCWAGLNGVFLKDNKTTQPVYWVHRAYADMSGSRLLNMTTSQKRSVALAARDDLSQTIRMLIGRYYEKGKKGPTADLEVTLEAYPFTNAAAVQAAVFRIPNGNGPASLSSPVAVSSNILPVNNGRIEFVLRDFRDGDAFNVILTPSP